jgi:hypothetical protein
MEREHLEHFLNEGYELGFVKQTDNSRFLGWILIQKRVSDERYLSLLSPGEEPEYVREQKLLRSYPYQVRIVELNREVFDDDRYETEEDFNLNEIRYFSSLDEVEKFIQQFGHSLKDIKWRTEINAP